MVADPVLLWLWHRQAAVAPIRPLAWEPPGFKAAGVALKKQKKKRAEDLNRYISQRKHTNGQQVPEKILYIISHQGDEIQNHLNPLEWPLSKRQEITNTNEDIERRELFALLLGM